MLFTASVLNSHLIKASNIYDQIIAIFSCQNVTFVTNPCSDAFNFTGMQFNRHTSLTWLRGKAAKH